MLLAKWLFIVGSTHSRAAIFLTLVALLASCGSASSAADAGAEVAADTAGGDSSSCDPSYKCSQAVMPPGNDPTKLCSGSVAAMKFTLVNACVCQGACMQ